MEHELPVNDAETKLFHYCWRWDSVKEFATSRSADRVLGTTTPDVLYRAEHHEENEGVCIYLERPESAPAR